MRYNKSKKTFGNEGEKMNIALEVRNRINKFCLNEYTFNNMNVTNKNKITDGIAKYPHFISPYIIIFWTYISNILIMHIVKKDKKIAFLIVKISNKI